MLSLDRDRVLLGVFSAFPWLTPPVTNLWNIVIRSGNHAVSPSLLVMIHGKMPTDRLRNTSDWRMAVTASFPYLYVTVPTFDVCEALRYTTFSRLLYFNHACSLIHGYIDTQLDHSVQATVSKGTEYCIYRVFNSMRMTIRRDFHSM